MENEIAQIIKAAQQGVSQAQDLAAVEKLRVEFLGKKGALTELLKGLNKVSVEQRPILGKAVNIAKHQLQTLFTEQESLIKEKQLNARLQKETIDITLPGRGQEVGCLHPVTRVKQRVSELFHSLGFEVAYGPEIEDDHHNFAALNFPEHHPARDSQDSFYFADGSLLRTHTSPVQIRVMEKQKPPFKVITPGRVYRRDSDPTHTPMFHQVEGLMIDRNVNFGHLKAVLNEFFAAFFERDVALRFRPSYFPFTEPSAEVDITHLACEGKGCRVCGYSGWLEVLGCGMVHPNVLRNVNIDPDEFSGYAFGLGLDRLAMLRYQIDDLRLMFDNDLRFLQQF